MKFIFFVCLAWLFYSTDGCECEFWRSLKHLSEFLNDLKQFLLKDMEVIYVFKRNCVLHETISNLHQKNTGMIYYVLEDDDVYQIHKLTTILMDMNSTPVYTILLHCPSFNFSQMIKTSLISIPMARWLLFHTQNLQQYSCRIGEISFSDTYLIKGPILVSRNCSRLYVLAEWTSSERIKQNSIVGLMDSTEKIHVEDQHLLAAMLNIYPFFSKAEKIVIHNENYTGIDFQVFHTLSRHFKFGYDTIVTPDRQWGRKENNTWTGMIGMVYYQNADVSMTDLSITAQRERDVDFSYPYYFDPVCFVVKSPNQVSRSIVLLQPLKLEIYLASVITIVIMSLAIHLVNIYEAPPRGWSLFDAMWYLCGAMSFQGGTIFIPDSNRIRIMIASWWICCLVVLTGYSGTLISYLNVPPTYHGIDNMYELLLAVNNGYIKAGTIAGTSILNNFLIATEEETDYYILGKQIINDIEGTVSKSIEEGVQRVHDRRYALIFPKGPLEPSVAKMGEGKFMFSSDQLFVTCYAMAMPKGSPLKKMFKLPILRIMAAGLIGKWHDELIDAKRVLGSLNDINHARRPKVMLLEDLRGALAVLVVGFSISLFVLIIEMIIHRSSKNSRSQISQLNVGLTYHS